MPSHIQVRVHRCAPILPFQPRTIMLGGLMSAAVIASDVALASELSFDLNAFSSGLASSVDTSRFNTSNQMSPGIYRVDIVVNGQTLGRREVEFVAAHAKTGAQPCLSREVLEKIGIAMDKVDTDAHGRELSNPAAAGQYCGDLGQWIPMASSTFDPGALELAASVPQAYMKRSMRGYIDPELLDEGIAAGLLNYNFSTNTVTAGEGDGRTYLGLNAGINLGAWRLRHQGAQAWGNRTGFETYQNTSTYVQRSIIPWQSQLTLGDTFSNGHIVDGVRVRGVTLATDDRMRPQTQQGYAPQVRGTADSNATVTVSQNGYTIYETTVPPGPFVISDLHATGYGGDLIVSVTEVDGRRNTFVVPYSVAPQLLRADATKYSATLGKVQQKGVDAKGANVFQGTLQHGLTDDLTVYGGGSVSKGYEQGKLGIALNTSFGAFSLDTATSHTEVPDHGRQSGQSLGLGYNKSLPASGTHFALGAYRFSTEGYLNLQDALNVREIASRAGDINSYARQKSRLDMTVSQQLGIGTLSLYGSSVDYWGGQEGRQVSFTASYGSTWNKVNWNLSAQRSRVQDTRQLTQSELSDDVFFGRIGQPGRIDNRYMLTLSMPLGGESRAPTINTSFSRDTGDTRGSQQQVGINGFLGEDTALNYGVSASRATSESTHSGQFNTYAGYRTDATQLRAGYSQSRDSSQLSFGADGGVVVHAAGIAFSQSLGEASALVHVPGAEGARLGGSSGARVNSSGFAVVPNLTAFQNNTVEIDPEGMSMDVELQESTRNVVPTSGAVSLVKFDTLSGRAVLVKGVHENGSPLPFAAQVFDAQGREVGVVGQASKAFVRDIPQEGRLTVKWGSKIAEQCDIYYHMPPITEGQRQATTDYLQGVCVASQGRQVAGQL
ncbi:fimbria/pilus outer membrane usher protein [Pseudomonas sp. PA-1-2A]|nr:fimbria/pilus outer membrane usher protein [Pseudomonas carnis]MCF5691229.1 fimbria/pilus outer membrane usher protein [Pseudomonas sp. PA-1-8C]MCF5787931.1 fimbria/pilus outer membrane usher protein [Pseudomonas sp. PA-1-6G]MCF5791629.1 fimbria/pilus outer membrane usher protein [Pseudomonas sp. PA-1-6B]MCF5800623.1 fimbria/pilus outer membrane usher protein [Pseudomonas sp. PA-1-5A]MCF5814707.1 fimbria/pilus outer membrane usher protein [Pseudomonas sp. PA-1-2A]MCF5834295.1 fimbria/pilus